jgi:predicted nuclease of predicted toxin-antitoxin system
VRFLIDACLPRDFNPLLQSFGDESIDIRDIGMRRAVDPEIALHALTNRLCLISEDWGFADIRIYPPARYHGIVLIETTDSGIDEKIAALRNLLERADIVAALPDRLAIVTPTKIRLRPPL